ncbi:hypothetical protein QTP88_017902 [Uroleucon formosanum]
MTIFIKSQRDNDMSLALRETYVFNYIIYTSYSKVVNEEDILNADKVRKDRNIMINVYFFIDLAKLRESLSCKDCESGQGLYKNIKEKRMAHWRPLEVGGQDGALEHLPPGKIIRT